MKSIDERIQKAIADLEEHCPGSNIAVFVALSFTDALGQTQCRYLGSGNHYARTGMCHEYLQRDRARTNEAIRKEEADDDGPQT